MKPAVGIASPEMPLIRQLRSHFPISNVCRSVEVEELQEWCLTLTDFYVRSNSCKPVKGPALFCSKFSMVLFDMLYRSLIFIS